MKNKYTRVMLGIVAVLGIILLASCGKATDSSSNSKKSGIKVMTTFYPMYDFAKNVVGDEGTVEMLIPAGSEPHDYEPSAKDLAKLTDADVFVYNSKAMETWVPNALENLDKKKVSVVEASQSIQLVDRADEEQGHEDTDAHDGHNHDHELDPHVWLDPVLAQKEVEAIRDALVKKYPDKKATFQTNADKYITKLKELDEAYKTAFANAKNRAFVTQHAAFGYLAKQYHLIQEPIAGISPDQEPSPSRLAELKKYITANGVSVIYFESTASSKVAKTLASETNVELAVLNPLESLTKKEQSAGKDYLSVMKDNLAALKKSIH
ncbi:metal ABC transporter substrate-binding protein [Enterococcus faecalis]